MVGMFWGGQYFGEGEIFVHAFKNLLLSIFDRYLFVYICSFQRISVQGRVVKTLTLSPIKKLSNHITEPYTCMYNRQIVLLCVIYLITV